MRKTNFFKSNNYILQFLVHTLSSFKMSVVYISTPDLKQSVIESVAAMLTSQVPEESKNGACIRIIQFIDGGLLAFQNEGYRVSQTSAMKAYNAEMKRTGVEALMMLSQQPAKQD